MNLIDQVVDYCDKKYQSECCSDDCKKIALCNENCKNCLDDLHYHCNRIRKTYDCQRLLYYYICRYSHKYCSEMLYALENVNFDDYPYLHILSLGCGGAADLMAFDIMNYPKDISYIGLDNNHLWEDIHKKIGELYHGGKVCFDSQKDVMQYFTEHILTDCNVIVIEYLISYLYNREKSYLIEELFNNLVNNVLEHRAEKSPFLIIINDVDSIHTGRDELIKFRNIIENHGFVISYEKRRSFKNPSYFQNAVPYSSNNNRFSIPPEIKDKYCTAITCESVQLILEVKADDN